jgi:hypothetical protein
MNDLIERSAVIDLIDKYTQDMSTDYWTANYGIPSGVFEDEIMELPSAQPEVIRCKDCKHWDGVDTCDVIDAPVWDNDFCSMAERRSDE